jgi:hypothetical protein
MFVELILGPHAKIIRALYRAKKEVEVYTSYMWSPEQGLGTFHVVPGVPDARPKEATIQ